MADPELWVGPTTLLVDEPFRVQVADARPGDRFTIRAEATDDAGVAWRSWAEFDADPEGRIDLDARAPLSGSYTGADAMGLVWGMERPPENSDALFDMSHTTPLDLRITLDQRGRIVASTEVKRLRRAEGVRRVPVDEDGLAGALYLPSGAGPHPALLHLSGSGGGISENSAALYASRGFACLALAYFAYPKRPEALVEIPLEYFGQGLRWLAKRPEVDAGRLAVEGASRGGELVLLLSTVFPEIRAVVSYAPSHVVWGRFGSERTPRAAWTWQGEPVPLAPSFLAYMEDEAQMARAAIPVERASAAILLVSGDDDQMWPSGAMAMAVEKRLQEAGYAHPFESRCYAGAGHMIASPFRPTTAANSTHPVNGVNHAYGGSPEAAAAANRDSWARVLEFLAEHLEVGAV